MNSISSITHENIDVSFMLQTIISRYDGPASYKQPDVLSLLRAGSGPLDEKNSAILKESELHVDNDLACIDADISHLSDALFQLTEKRRLLDEAKRKHQAVLSPISALPLEILTDILCHAASDPIDIFDTKHPAWAISKVCQQWRSTITTLCPEVWARILVSCVSYSSAMLKNGALSSVLDTVLSRSQTHKLDITIGFDFTCDQNDPVLELQGNIWAALTAYAERWEKLNLSLSQFDMSELLGLRSRLSSLKECVLHCYEMGPRLEFMIDAFEHTPELMHMDLRGMAPNTFVPFTAPNLESFKYRVEICDNEEWNDGDGISLEYFFNIIRNSPNLVAVDVICEYSSYDTVSPRIVKPLLSKLAVNNTAFLRSLLVPTLKEATLTTDFYDSESGQPGSPTDFLADFHDLLVESRCSTLSRLVISINLLNQHLLSILQLAPALISFKLYQYTWKDQYDVVMQELVVQLTNAEAFLPRLEEIDLNLPICRGVDIYFADCAMVNMVAARWHRSLRKFYLVTEFARFCNLDADNIEQLEAFKAEGLDVSLLGEGMYISPRFPSFS